VAYQHGVQGVIVPSTDSLPPSGVGTLPVYIGTAPVNTLESTAAVVNVPILVNSFDDAKTKLGYSDDWEEYTLCEAMDAHFRNRIQPIGPIVLINVFDPSVHDEETPVTETDIIGGNTGGVRKGIAVVDLVYQTYNMIPTILAAPGWSQTKTVKEALVTKAQKINGHWDAIVVADIDSDTTNSISAAKSWKETNGYTDHILKAGWPKGQIAGKVFHASTLMVVRMQQTDFANDNVPYESPSNKQVDIISTVLGDGTPIVFDELQANELNADGITTFNFRSGIWVLWGPHNANYVYGADVKPEDKFDASIRMLRYLTNSFQQRYMQDIDGPLHRSMKDTILNDAGIWLNSFVASGRLLSGSISFNETSNPTSSIVEGDFVFDIATTTTPVAKSMTFRIQYTTAGLQTLFGGETA
jgi:uncharacterized protein